ncbi:546_t:CDS:1, partial [Funneliformis caledonium]
SAKVMARGNQGTVKKTALIASQPKKTVKVPAKRSGFHKKPKRT